MSLENDSIVIIKRDITKSDGCKGEINLNSITICKNINLNEKLVDYDLINVWNKLSVKPLVIVFDLDLTFWPFLVDSHCKPPFKKLSNGNGCSTVVDQDDKTFTFFSEVPKILNTLRNYCLRDSGYMAVASRTKAGESANQLLEMYGWKDYFNSFQMYLENKVYHINEICKELGVTNMQEILFYDDNPKNITSTSPLGLTAYLIDYRNGLTLSECVKGLIEHESRHKQ